MGKRKTEKVGSPDDVANVNPFTNAAWNNNQRLVGNLGNMIYGQPGQEGGYLRGLIESGDPTAAYNWFMGAAPEFQALAMDYTNPFVQGQRDLANIEASNAVQDVAAQFGGPANAYYSGAAANAMLGEAGRIRQQMMNNVIGAQTQAAGNLMNNALGTAPGAFGQVRAQDIGILGQMMGAQDSAMGRMTALGAPQWWQPTYVQQPSTADKIFGGMGAIGSMAGGLLGLGPMGLGLFGGGD